MNSRARKLPRQQGNALILSLTAVVLVSLFASAMLSSVDNASKAVVVDHDRARAQKFAEGLLEVAEQRLSDDISNLPVPLWALAGRAQVIVTAEAAFLHV